MKLTRSKCVISIVIKLLLFFSAPPPASPPAKTGLQRHSHTFDSKTQSDIFSDATIYCAVAILNKEYFACHSNGIILKWLLLSFTCGKFALHSISVPQSLASLEFMQNVKI